MSLFNNTSQRAKQREAAIQERNRMIVERRMIPKLIKEFNRTQREAAIAYLGGGREMIAMVMLSHQKELTSILQSAYAVTVTGTAKRTMDEAGKSNLIKIEKKDAQSAIERLTSTYLTTYAAERADLIRGTSGDLIMGTILAGTEAGKDTQEIAKDISKSLGGSIGRSRSQTIARTETHASSQHASLKTVEELSLPPMQKEWVAFTDSRTRDHHKDRRVNGQLVNLDEHFNVFGSRMMHPGDRNGPPEEVINCRCVMVYESEF